MAASTTITFLYFSHSHMFSLVNVAFQKNVAYHRKKISFILQGRNVKFKCVRSHFQITEEACPLIDIKP